MINFFTEWSYNVSHIYHKLEDQRINSKKIFCYMLNGIAANSENCHPQQNYNLESNSSDIKEVKKLLLLEND